MYQVSFDLESIYLMKIFREVRKFSKTYVIQRNIILKVFRSMLGDREKCKKKDI